MSKNTKVLQSGFDASKEAIIAALKEEGFGVLTEVDVKNTLKTKIDVDFRRYTILGACNPKLAHQALQTELSVGLMMPCNVVLYENDDATTTVIAVDPTKSAGALGSAGLTEFAESVKTKLEAVVARL